MASFRDESFNMSVDNDTIDVVWHSTQQPAIQSILNESKCTLFCLLLFVFVILVYHSLYISGLLVSTPLLHHVSDIAFSVHQQQNGSSAWDPNQTPLIAECFATAPKSLFKDSSASRTVSLLGSHSAADTLKPQVRSRPGMGRVTSSPSLPASYPSNSVLGGSTTTIDPRKIRPSQRHTLQTNVLSGKSEYERNSQVHSAGSIENLDHLHEMIKSVGRTWGKVDVSSVESKPSSLVDRPPSRTNRARTNLASGSNSRSASTSSDEMQNPQQRSKPRVATTIKVLKVPPHLQKASLSRQNDKRGLMLPPALPVHRNLPTEVNNLQFPSKSPIEANTRLQWIDTSMQLDPDDDESPETPTYPNKPASPSPPSSQSSQLSQRRTSESVPRQQLLEQNVVTASQPLSQPQPVKALGMRRTLSGNRYETTPSSQQAPSRQTKHSLPSIPAQRTSSPAVGSSSSSPAADAQLPLSNLPLPPESMRVSSELATRSKSFKVPWASNTSPTEQFSSQQHPPNSQSPTTSVSSESSPHSGNAGRQAPKVEQGDMSMPNENPDSSYSFDDFDPEELDRVLSQHGA